MPRILVGDTIKNKENIGYIIFEKNNKIYKVKEKDFFKRGRRGLYNLTKSSTLFELTIQENVSKVIFENCSLLFPTKSKKIKLELWNRSAESELEFKNVYFDSRKEADITINIVSPYSNVKAQNVKFEKIEKEHTLNITAMNANICDIQDVNLSVIASADKEVGNIILSEYEYKPTKKDDIAGYVALSLKAAPKGKIVLEDIDIETVKTIKIISDQLEYYSILLCSPDIKIGSTASNIYGFQGQELFNSDTILKNDIFTITDESLKKLELIQKLQSCLKVIKQEVNKEIDCRVNAAIYEFDNKNEEKLNELKNKISEITNTRTNLIGEVTTEEQLKPIEKIYKKNTK